FRPGLQKGQHFFESHHRQVVDCSSPAYAPTVEKAGIEQSTTCRWWDSGNRSCPCRLGLKHPPLAGGGIRDRRNSKSLGNDKLTARGLSLFNHYPTASRRCEQIFRK
ncbi:MAG: hypothetical protein ACREEM_39515, partial [Blastocatellia bacterium]